jgi:hypothetical protein
LADAAAAVGLRLASRPGGAALPDGEAPVSPSEADSTITRLRRPPVPEGYNPSTFGSDLIRWGVGAADAEARLSTVNKADVVQMTDKGLSKEMAKNWKDFYKSQEIHGRGKDVAGPRADLMQKILDLWP